MSSIKKISRDETGTDEGPPLAVHIAVTNNDLKNLQQLIQSGAPQLHKKTYETALHVAARTPALECMKWLLDNYINSPRDQDCNGSTPCHYAVVYGNLDALKMLLAHDPRIEKELTEMREENGLTIMGLATLQGDVPTVEWMVNKFPGLAYIKDNSGNLPIHLAAAGGAVEIVRFLVERYGRDYAVQSSSEKKFQPLYYAVDKGKTNVVKYLIEEVKVDPLAKAKGGMTTLHAAVTAHQVTITKWLIEKLGPNVILSKSDDGATLLHLAAAEGLPDLLEYLINMLPDKTTINVSDDSGSTPAHDSAEFGEKETLIVLLRNGADITLMNQNQETPFDLAVQNNHSEIINIITEYRENGLKSLNSYTNSDTNVRTSQREAEEITGLIQQTTNIVEKRKEEEVSRKISLQRLTDDDDLDDSGDELERELMKNRENDRVSRSKLRGSREEVDLIPHEMGPDGTVYAKIKKSTIEKKKAPPLPPPPPRERDNMSEVGSVASSSHRVARLTSSSMDYKKNRTSGSRLGVENDSTSSIGTSVSHSKKIETYNGGGNGSSFHPPYGYYPPAPYYNPQFHRGGPRSTASGSSVGSTPFQPPHSLPGGYPQYPYMPAMVAQYYGYPYPPQYYPMHPKAKGINERIHMEALQKTGGGQPFLAPPHPGFKGHPKYGQFGHMRHHSRPTSSRSSARSVPVNRGRAAANIKHTDRAIGFGPTSNEEAGLEDLDEDHPAPPPITKGGKIDHDPTELLHANFIMMKADKEGKVPKEASGGTKLQRAKPPDKYDGRYNNYIETDSEDERELPDHVRVSSLADSALILMMIPILGLKGQQRNRSKETAALSPKAYDEMEAQKISKQWSQQNVVDKFKQPSTSKTSVTTEITDWSEMLGLSTPQPTQTKDISGSIRARNFVFQGLKPSSISQSMASLARDEEEDDDDDIISVVIGNDLTTEETKEKKKKQQTATTSSSEKPKAKSSSKKERSGKHSSSTKREKGSSSVTNKHEKSSSTSKHAKKSSSGEKETTSGSKKSRSSQKTDLKKKSTKEGEGRGEAKKSSKKLKMTVTPTTTTDKGQEKMKEMQLKKTHLTNHNNQVVTSVSIKTGKGGGGGGRQPVELPNIAVIDVSDSEGEEDIDGGVRRRNIATPTSQGSFDVENIFAETEKEIEQMLAGMPSSNVETDIDEKELRDGPKSSSRSHEEHEQLEKLQGMFPQNSTQQGTVTGGTEGGGGDELLSIIEALKMNPEEVTPQQKMRIQLIQNILVGKDPELRAQLLSLMSQGWSPTGDDDMAANGSSTQLIADIENKLLESQEKQRKETEQHFRSQAEFTETLQRRLEEQAARHMENIQMQLDLQKKMMMQQLEEQKRLLEQERTRVSEQERQGRVKVRSKHNLSSDSDSGEELVHSTPHPVMLAKKGRTSTMTAEIQHLLPLKWEDFSVDDSNDKSGIPDPPPLPPLSYLLETVDDPAVRQRKLDRAGRRTTKIEYENTSRALEKFTSLDIIPISDDEEEEEEEEAQRGLRIAKAKIATRKKADIVKVQQNLQKKSLSSFVQNTRFGSAAKTMVVS